MLDPTTRNRFSIRGGPHKWSERRSPTLYSSEIVLWRMRRNPHDITIDRYLQSSLCKHILSFSQPSV